MVEKLLISIRNSTAHYSSSSAGYFLIKFSSLAPRIIDHLTFDYRNNWENIEERCRQLYDLCYRTIWHPFSRYWQEIRENFVWTLNSYTLILIVEKIFHSTSETKFSLPSRGNMHHEISSFEAAICQVIRTVTNASATW